MVALPAAGCVVVFFTGGLPELEVLLGLAGVLEVLSEAGAPDEALVVLAGVDPAGGVLFVLAEVVDGALAVVADVVAAWGVLIALAGVDGDGGVLVVLAGVDAADGVLVVLAGVDATCGVLVDLSGVVD